MMGIHAALFLSTLAVTGQPPASEDVPLLNYRKITLPINIDPKAQNDISSLILFVSTDGKTWNQEAIARADMIAKPKEERFFTYEAKDDCVHYFHMQTLFKNGKQDPPDLAKAKPGLVIGFDTKLPVVTLEIDRFVDGDYATNWVIQEANPDLGKLLVEYHSGDNRWQRLEVRPDLTGSYRFKSNGSPTVRVSLTDKAGNRGEAVKTYKAGGGSAAVRLPDGPNLDPMREEIKPVSGGIAPLPGGSGTNGQYTRSTPVPLPDNPNPDQMPGHSNNGASRYPEQNGNVGGFALQPPPNLPPIQCINVTKFDLSYEVKDSGPSGVSEVQLWVTRDYGKSWMKWDSVDKIQDRFPVNFAKANNREVEGHYGLKIVLVSGAGQSKGAPVAGDLPDMMVEVDTTSPTIKIHAPKPLANTKDTLLIRWSATDKNLAAEPITLEWGESSEGPWTPIAATEANPGVARRVANTGEYAWKVPANFPAPKVYLRATARDAAGNVGEFRTTESVTVDFAKPEAKIGGIVGVSK